MGAANHKTISAKRCKGDNKLEILEVGAGTVCWYERKTGGYVCWSYEK